MFCRRRNTRRVNLMVCVRRLRNRIRLVRTRSRYRPYRLILRNVSIWLPHSPSQGQDPLAARRGPARMCCLPWRYRRVLLLFGYLVIMRVWRRRRVCTLLMKRCWLEVRVSLLLHVDRLLVARRLVLLLNLLDGGLRR